MKFPIIATHYSNPKSLKAGTYNTLLYPINGMPAFGGRLTEKKLKM
jgi:hypothetical protein